MIKKHHNRTRFIQLGPNVPLYLAMHINKLFVKWLWIMLTWAFLYLAYATIESQTTRSIYNTYIPRLIWLYTRQTPLCTQCFKHVRHKMYVHGRCLFIHSFHIDAFPRSLQTKHQRNTLP